MRSYKDQLLFQYFVTLHRHNYGHNGNVQLINGVERLLTYVWEVHCWSAGKPSHIKVLAPNWTWTQGSGVTATLTALSSLILE